MESVGNILEVLKEGTLFHKTLIERRYTNETVQLEFAEGSGISAQERSLFDVSGFNAVLDPSRGNYFIGIHKKARDQTRPMEKKFCC